MVILSSRLRLNSSFTWTPKVVGQLGLVPIVILFLTVGSLALADLTQQRYQRERIRGPGGN